MTLESLLLEPGADPLDQALLTELEHLAKTDRDFAQFLGEEFRDLDRQIAPLVYVLWKKHVVHTLRSCQGHTGQYHIEVGSAKTPGMFVYAHSHLLYTDIDATRSERFVLLLRDAFAHIPSFNIREANQTSGKPMNVVVIGMDDIAIPQPATNSSWREPREIPKDLAIERANAIHYCWKHLALRVYKEF